MLANRHRIGRQIALDELGDGVEDEPMVRAIQRVRRNDVCYLVPGPLIEHETAEQGLLRFDRVRRQPQAFGGTAANVGGCGRVCHRRPASRRRRAPLLGRGFFVGQASDGFTNDVTRVLHLGHEFPVGGEAPHIPFRSRHSRIESACSR